MLFLDSPGKASAASELKPLLGKVKSKADDRVWSEVAGLDVTPLLCEHSRYSCKVWGAVLVSHASVLGSILIKLTRPD